MDRSIHCCTSRASEGRGSSLTLGKVREREPLLMVTWRKAETVWKSCTESQSSVLGSARPAEFDGVEGIARSWGDCSFVVTAHAGQGRGSRNRND